MYIPLVRKENLTIEYAHVRCEKIYCTI